MDFNESNYVRYRMWRNRKRTPRSFAGRMILSLASPLFVMGYIVFLNVIFLLMPSIYFHVFLHVPMGLALVSLFLANFFLFPITVRVLDVTSYHLWLRHVLEEGSTKSG